MVINWDQYGIDCIKNQILIRYGIEPKTVIRLLSGTRLSLNINVGVPTYREYFWSPDTNDFIFDKASNTQLNRPWFWGSWDVAFINNTDNTTAAGPWVDIGQQFAFKFLNGVFQIGENQIFYFDNANNAWPAARTSQQATAENNFNTGLCQGLEVLYNNPSLTTYGWVNAFFNGFKIVF